MGIPVGDDISIVVDSYPSCTKFCIDLRLFIAESDFPCSQMEATLDFLVPAEPLYSFSW
jgi:hypothetical protein